MKPHAKIRSEAKMIAAILAGDTRLFHELIRAHEHTIYRTALYYMENEADADDVAQETFIKAVANLSTYRAELKFSAWLSRITRNEARRQLRHAAAFPIVSLDDPSAEGGTFSLMLLPDLRESPSEIFGRAETREILRQSVRRLPEIYRRVFLLRDVEELNVNETAKALNISVPSVKVRLHRARMMLQKRLAPQLKNVPRAPQGRRSK